MEADRKVLHVPVLLKESIELLGIAKGSIVIDGTAGFGGHSSEILKIVGEEGMLVLMDKSPESIGFLRKHFASYTNVHVFHEGFENMRYVAESLNISGKVDAILLDLGLSSFLIERSGRGFSYRRRNEPLDMRYDPERGEPLKDVLPKLTLEQIEFILRTYGEERFYRRIAKALKQAKKMETTGDLIEVVERSVPRKYLNKALMRVFQAFRIYINRELEALEEALMSSLSVLRTGGRIAVISYHSLEDRLVKRFSKLPYVARITKKPITPSKEELKANPRSRSAKLRVMEVRENVHQDR